jgi:hypothetical protein
MTRERTTNTGTPARRTSLDSTEAPLIALPAIFDRDDPTARRHRLTIWGGGGVGPSVLHVLGQLGAPFLRLALGGPHGATEGSGETLTQQLEGPYSAPFLTSKSTNTIDNGASWN